MNVLHKPRFKVFDIADSLILSPFRPNIPPLQLRFNSRQEERNVLFNVRKR